jgi:hypothetical protein
VKRSLPRVILVLLVLAVSASVVLAAKTCPSCGASNKDSDKFCKNCGARLPEPPPARPTLPRISGAASVDGPVVRITSQPSGAAVDVDRRSQGRTPLELDGLSPGRHEYALSRDGHRTFYGEFTITGRFGSIVVTSDPVGAEVLLDGEPRGTATEEGLALDRVRYGPHTITARLKGYNDLVKTVDVDAPEPVSVTCRLVYSKGWLLVVSEPSGATLVVNNDTAGNTPHLAELVPDRYALSVSRPGYYKWSGDANVQYAESTRVRAILDRIETRKAPFLFLAIASLGAGVVSTVMGESEYAKYRGATTPEEAERYRRSTRTWDYGRYVGLGAGVALAGVYWMVKW